MSKLEIWHKNKNIMFVEQHQCCEWRYEIREGTKWISGMTLYSLMRDGWQHIGYLFKPKE